MYAYLYLSCHVCFILMKMQTDPNSFNLEKVLCYPKYTKCTKQTKRPRPRRKKNEIKRIYSCFDCDKKYGTKSHLMTHEKMKH